MNLARIKAVKQISKLILANKIKSAVYFLIGLFFAALMPQLLTPGIIKKLLTIKPLNCFVFLILFVIACLLLYEKWLIFYKRYRNNYILNEQPFTYVDGLLISITSFALSLFFLNFFTKISHFFSVFLLLIVLGNSCLLLTYFGLLFEKDKVEKQNKSKSNKKEVCYSDEAISEENQDLLGRGSFVDALYKQIEYMPASPFVIGLYGGWGTGKTSVLNLLGGKISKDDSMLLVKFSPWYFESQEALLKNFYKSIQNAINKVYFIPDLKKVFRKYLNVLSVTSKNFRVNLGSLCLDDDIEALKGRMELNIKKTGRKVVVFIDDIDRLHSKEVLLVFKLVKLLANLKNVIFLLSFDIDVVAKLLKKELELDSDFLEKIVQHPINLPVIEQEDIDKFLYYSSPDGKHKPAIGKLFYRLNISESRIKQFEKDFTPLYNIKIKLFFTTLRSAKRYMNGLNSMLAPIEKEVNLYDFLLLEIVRVFYPTVYTDIWKYPWYYLPNDWGKNLLLLCHAFSKDKRNEQAREHIEELLNTQKSHDLLLDILKEIFFEVENAYSNKIDSKDKSTCRIEKRVTHPYCFNKYFYLKTPSIELSDEFIESKIEYLNSLDEQKIPIELNETYLYLKRENKLSDFLNKLIIFSEQIDPDKAESIVRSLYENFGIFSNKEEKYRTEYGEARRLIMNLINYVIKGNERQGICEELVKNVKSLKDAVFLVNSIKSRVIGITKGDGFGKIKEVVSARLEEYFIKGERDIFKDAEEDAGYILSHWSSDWDDFKGKNNKELNDYVLGLIDNNPHYLGNVIGLFTAGDKELINEYVYGKLTQAYKDELYKMAKKLDLSENISVESFIYYYDNEQAQRTKQQKP